MTIKNTTELKMPYDNDAEKAIISIILAEPERFIKVADLLEVKDFYFLSHQEIWKTMLSLFNAGQDIDIVSIKIELSKYQTNIDPIMSSLTECYEEGIIGKNIFSFVEQVKNKSLLREIIGVTNSHLQEAKLEDTKATAVLCSLEKDIIDIYDKVQDDRAIDAKGIITEIRKDIEHNENNVWNGFDTGFKWIDKQTGGLLATHCWIVGAYTGTGKTFFLLQMLLNILKQKAKVMLFSTEMDRKMNMLRLLCNIAGVSTIYTLKGLLDSTDKERVRLAQEELSAYKDNLIIYDNVYDVEDIRLKAKKKKLQSGLDVIFVDFIQNLRGAENIYERMSNAAINLQKIAQELKVCVVIASQVSQSAAGWSSKEAIEYKGAGEIAAIADVGVWIKRVEEDISMREVILRKVRHGVPGKKNVRISFPSGRITDVVEEVGDDNVTGQL